MSYNLEESLRGLIQIILDESISNPDSAIGIALKRVLAAAGNPDDEVYQMIPVEFRQMVLAALPMVKKHLRGAGLEIE